MSKVGLTALSRIQQRQFDKDSRGDLIVNAMCPGYTKTDMSSNKGSKTPEEGADTAIYLALLGPNVKSPKGEFWAERKAVEWGDLNWTWS
jgi:carbonyl reductase 1